jgi:hypothetical protein
MIIWKRRGLEALMVYYKTLSRHSRPGTEENHEKNFKTFGIQAELRNRNPQYTSLKRLPLEPVCLVRLRHLELIAPIEFWPVTVAERSKAWTVFARLDAVIVGSNPTKGMGVWCVYVSFGVYAVLCLGRGLATSWSLVQGVLPIVNRSGNWKV